jgi:segregation and condensation protein B
MAEDREIKNMDVAAVVSTEPAVGASVADIAGVVPGVVVAVDSPDVAQETASQPSEIESERNTPLHLNGGLKGVIESMLFVTPEPLSAKQLSESLGVEIDRIEAAVDALEADLNAGHALQLMRVAGGYQLCTRPEYAQYCSLILQPVKRKLSQAALETLAIISYRQPCTIPEIEAVRGVSVDGVMKTLLERGLVKEAGRKQAPGRPMLFTTTQQFLEHFGLNDLSELPDIDSLAIERVKALEAQKALLSEEDLGQAPTRKLNEEAAEGDS